MGAGVLSSLGGVAFQTGLGVAAALPGKMEKAYRQDILSDRARLANGAGGMSEAQRQMAQSQAMQQIQAQQGAALAQLARGSATGDSGARQAGMQGVYRAGMGAQNQAMSNIRQQDLALAEAQRQDLQQRMLQAQAMGNQRKTAALQYFQRVPAAMGSGGQAGAADRNVAAETINSGGNTISPTGGAS